MKTYVGTGGIASDILKLGTVWRWLVHFIHFYPQSERIRMW